MSSIGENVAGRELGATRASRARHASSRTNVGARLSSVSAALSLALALVAPTAHAILANDRSLTAARLTSTQGLKPAELSLYSRLGRFRGFLGTPIDATHFITAQHIGIAATDTITFTEGPNVGTYSIASWGDDPGSDLRIVKITGTFQDWVPLNGSNNEANKTATIFGRGGAPQASVYVGLEFKGWTATASDGQISWGRNVVAGTIGANQLYSQFNINGLPQEAGLTSGDSGGPWFAPDGQGYLRLIGISYAATGPYQYDVAGAPNGAPFEAALVDTGGLWLGSVGSAVFTPENPINVPSVIVASRISDRIGWIATQIDLSINDTDLDGVLDEFDNCPFLANANQLDNGGVGVSTTPDGIGNACQCGDVTGEGQANNTDATYIKRHALGLSAVLFLVPDNCDVTGDGTCNGTDATLIRQAVIGNMSPLFGQNCPNATP